MNFEQGILIFFGVVVGLFLGILCVLVFTDLSMYQGMLEHCNMHMNNQGHCILQAVPVVNQ